MIAEEHVVCATDTEATLRALVNPEGFATTYRFQYTDRGAFGQSFEGASPPRSAPEPR